MWSTVSFLKVSVPMRIYIKIKQWVLKAQSHNLYKSQLCGSRVFGAKVGDTVMVDGFSKPGMTSKSWHKAGNKDSQSTVVKPPPLREQITSRKPVNPLVISQQDTSGQALRFLPLVDKNTFPELRRQQNWKNSIAVDRKNEKLIKNTYLPQIPLPPVPRAGHAHPSFYYATPSADSLLRSSSASFSERSGRTPSENAIYCLAVAR